MPATDPHIDAYKEKSADFAKPVLNHLRKLVHRACPQVEETIKLGIPCFDYKGSFCSFPAFKAHAVFGFWKITLMAYSNGVLTEKRRCHRLPRPHFLY